MGRSSFPASCPVRPGPVRAAALRGPGVAQERHLQVGEEDGEDAVNDFRDAARYAQCAADVYVNSNWQRVGRRRVLIGITRGRSPGPGFRRQRKPASTAPNNGKEASVGSQDEAEGVMQWILHQERSARRCTMEPSGSTPATSPEMATFACATTIAACANGGPKTIPWPFRSHMLRQTHKNATGQVPNLVTGAVGSAGSGSRFHAWQSPRPLQRFSQSSVTMPLSTAQMLQMYKLATGSDCFLDPQLRCGHLSGDPQPSGATE